MASSLNAARLATGLCALSLAMLHGPPAQAGTVTVLHDFTGGADGAVAYKGVTIDAAGNLFGENYWGADACPDSFQFPGIGCGVVYKLAPSGAASTLVTFLGAPNGATGATNVTLYKDYVLGGAYSGGPSNLGLLYAVKTNGTGYRVLHGFSGPDGAHPTSFPRVDASGTLYSIASQGGPAFTTDGTGFGVLFAITPSFQYVPQHFFSGGADGGAPGRIFLDGAGTIYGSTNSGGACAGTGLPAAGCGTLYRFVPSTGAFTTLYTFTGGTDGYLPQLGGLDSQGSLYGVTSYGGSGTYGTVFKLAKTAGGYTYQLLHSFSGGTDGATPLGPPSVSAAGALTGTTFYGPVTATATGAGTLFTLKQGVFTTLFTFTNDARGGYPQGTPVTTRTGAIIGTTPFGGSHVPCNTAGGTLISIYGCGVVYQYTPAR